MTGTAFADSGHARISLASNSGFPGAAVQGSGSGFSATGSAVQISFGSTGGPTLWTGRPAGNGTLSFSFTVPNAPPGSYSIVATQSQADGAPVPGTPARTTLVVTAATDPPSPGTSLGPLQPPQPVLPRASDPPASSPTPAPPDSTAAPADTAAASTPGPSPAPGPASLRARPPQVATLWRVAGADPGWVTGFAVSTAISQTTPPLVPAGAGLAIVASTLATALTLRRRGDGSRRNRPDGNPSSPDQRR